MLERLRFASLALNGRTSLRGCSTVARRFARAQRLNGAMKHPDSRHHERSRLP
jgi:hypothetical protein